MSILARLIVSKSDRLVGEVTVSGAKNAVLPIIAATLLVEGKSVIKGVPNLSDVNVMCDLLRYLGAIVEFENDTLTIDAKNITKNEAPYELVGKMRASFLVLGPLIARFKRATVSMPGGCPIGTRPIDLHLKGFKMLNTKVEIEHGCIDAYTTDLIANHIYLDFPSVGATENIIMAASLADGVTVIENAAEEPEIVDLANFINEMGGKVRGAGTNTIRITGVKKLNEVEHTVIPDRIEAGTYMVAAAVTRGDIYVRNVINDHLRPVIAKLIEVGCKISEEGDFLRVIGPDIIRATDIKTMPHPGFPTDMQSLFMTLLSVGDASSLVTETVFENRFMNVNELKRMGADIKIEGKSALVTGVKELQGTSVKATDLRAGASLILAGLIANGKTEITDIHHIDRGYVDIENKIRALGGKITRVED
ncbi:UDP-N-acetylglucosamine 1-carboxyvinyltransferase [[Eubacterium] yurii subsp. margaretiae ATCC 43715]|nr:UDP-N-acetylglucosamine 1-carboxyvinyltransferase [[Eubacterium] yurii subsp. margaretiae ATCC 43715]